MRYGETLAFVWRYIRRQPLRLAFLFCGLLFTTACDVFMPVFSGRLADAVATGIGTDAPDPAHLTAAMEALLGLILLEAVFTLARLGVDKQWIRLETAIQPRLVTDVFHRVQRFSTDWHANSFAGATVRKITRGRGAYDVFTNTVFYGLLPALFIVVGMTLMIGLHWPLMSVFLAAMLVAYVAVSCGMAILYLAPANQRFIRSDTRVGALLADSLTCNAVVKAFGGERREDATIGGENANWGRLGRIAWGRQVNMQIAQRVMNLLLMAGMLGLAVLFWARGLATPGQVTMVLTSFFVVSAYVRFLGQHMRNLQQSVNDMEDMIEFMARPVDIGDRPDARLLHCERGEIVFRHVTFSYENQPEPLYDDFSLTIKAGEKVGLVGRSGSGKSTFVKLIERLYDIDNGTLAIDGQDIAALTQESLRQAIAIVPQEPILFHRSLAENIAYGRPEATMEEIVHAARRAHADEFINALPLGYGTLVGERGIKLSGGERQRVALARAFLADAPILVLDEATSSLDSHTEALIQESIHALMQGRTTIVIAHRLSTIRDMDRILVFEKGRIVEDGPHARLMAEKDGRYRALVLDETRQGNRMAWERTA
jgi:ATP-binding cassette subfamily B protein